MVYFYLYIEYVIGFRLSLMSPIYLSRASPDASRDRAKDNTQARSGD